jgi:hypothetical protein
MSSKENVLNSEEAASPEKQSTPIANYFNINMSKSIYEKASTPPTSPTFGSNGFLTDNKDNRVRRMSKKAARNDDKPPFSESTPQSAAKFLMGISNDFISVTQTLKEKFFNHNKTVTGDKYFTYEFCHQQVLIHSFINSVQKELQCELETAGKGSFPGVALLLAETIKLCVDVEVAYKIVGIEERGIDLLLKRQGRIVEELMVWVMKLGPLSSD